MSDDRSARKVVATSDGVDLIAVAHALEEEFGVALLDADLARVGSYAELLQLVRDELEGGSDAVTDDAISSCFVRARVVAGGSDGRVALVRVGWLTPDLVAAVADDVRQAPKGTWLEVLVPDELSDAELDGFHHWLRDIVSAHVQVDVRRSADRLTETVRPSATGECDRLTRSEDDASDGALVMRRIDSGTHLAFPAEKQQLQCTQRRRSES